MLSHVHIGVRDFDRAFAFYGALLPVVGWTLKFVEPGKPWAGWHPDHAERPLFVIGAPFDGAPADPGNGNMIALQAASRAIVDAAYETAMANGATSEGKPGFRPEYHEQYYGAYLRDHDGNKLCVCCHAADHGQD